MSVYPHGDQLKLKILLWSLTKNPNNRRSFDKIAYAYTIISALKKKKCVGFMSATQAVMHRFREIFIKKNLAHLSYNFNSERKFVSRFPGTIVRTAS